MTTSTSATDVRAGGAGGLGPDALLGVGLAGSVLAAAALVHFGAGARGLIAGAFCVSVVALAAYDLECRLIPNRIVLPAIALVLVAQLVAFPAEALEWLGATVGAGVVLYLPRLFKRDAVGVGDVKLAMLLGAGLGGEVVNALLFGSLAAAPVAIWILATRGETERGQTIPLAPFLAVGAILAVFLGDLPA
jgi:prepilin signal peptidase PulO-like enzyme (type II secretory pathway)